MTVITEAQLQTTINDLVAAEVRKQVAARDDQQQPPADATDAEVEKELAEFAKAVDADSGLREALGGASFMDAFEGRAGEKAERTASVIYKGFTADAPWPASPQDIGDYVADVGEQTEELGLLASPLKMTDEVVEAELSADDKQRFALGGEEAIRDPLAGESLSDWARERQQNRIGLERLARDQSVEDESPTGPVSIIDGQSFGDSPATAESMPAGFGEDCEQHDPQDREEDARRRAAERERTGVDNRTGNEVARGVPAPGQQHTDAPVAADDAADELEKRNAFREAIGLDPLPAPRVREAPRPSGPAAERGAESSAKFPGELARDSEYKEPRGPGSR
ncbi:MAG: hypothetical protein IH830_03895 [Planctomycetes bacterium]|nr:hypothetical protein [Planctomycetota bacterium]